MSKELTQDDIRAARVTGVDVWDYDKARNVGVTHTDIMTAHEAGVSS